MPVYLIRAGEHGPVKIGFSDNVLSRLSKIQTDLPQTLVILRILDGGKELEAALHSRFRHLRERGEWFSFSKDMLGDLGAANFVLKARIKQSGAPTVWTADARAKAAASQMAVQNDPIRRAARNERLRETQLRKVKLQTIHQVVIRVGSWMKFASHLGLPLTEVMAWEAIPVRYAELVAAAAKVPVMKLSNLLERTAA